MISEYQNLTETKTIRLFTILTFYTGVCILIYLIVFSGIKINHDCAYFLQTAQLLLKGNIPYIDYISVNPPLADYLHIFPVILSSILGISIPMSFYTSVTFLTVLSSVLVYLILSKSDTFQSINSPVIISFTVVLTSLMVLSWGLYGQREHLFVLGYLPFLFMREARYRGKSFALILAVLVGLIMSLFALLKPHFVLIVTVIETWMLFRKRDWKVLLSPELIAAVTIGLAYLVHFLLVPKSMFNALFYRWIPFNMSHYDVYNTTRIKGFFFYPIIKTLIIFLGVLAIFSIVHIKIKRHSVLLECFLISIFTGYGIYIFQFKGWRYHIIPFTAFLIFFLIIVIMILLENLNVFFKRYKSILHPVYLILLLILLIFVNFKYIQYGRRTVSLRNTSYPFLDEFSDTIKKHSQIGDRVTFITTTMVPVYPTVLYANRLPGSRHVISSPIAKFYEGIKKNKEGSFPYRTSENWPEDERKFLKELGEDILARKPKIVFVHSKEGCIACPHGFNIHEYLIKSGWWEKYFYNYTYLAVLNEFKIYLYHS